MGDALVVMTVPEEAWMIPMGEKRTPEDRHRRRTISLAIEAGDVWEPPPEPTEQYGFKWYEHPEVRQAHREAVRQSLEEFLNEHLARLYHMLRTGWWVLGKVRVRVVECRPVPEREMRQLTRALRRATSGGRRRPPRARRRVGHQ
jgi:hypothetical protein